MPQFCTKFYIQNHTPQRNILNYGPCQPFIRTILQYQAVSPNCLLDISTDKKIKEQSSTKPKLPRTSCLKIITLPLVKRIVFQCMLTQHVSCKISSACLYTCTFNIHTASFISMNCQQIGLHFTVQKCLPITGPYLLFEEFVNKKGRKWQLQKSLHTDQKYMYTMHV